MARSEKKVMLIGIDDSEPSIYALEWTVNLFFSPDAAILPFKLVVLHAKPTPSSSIILSGPGAVDVLSLIDETLKKTASRVIAKAKEICSSKSVSDVMFQVVEGDARNVLCDAVEKHQASVLVVGSHGHGAIKRAFLGSVSDYCTHHAHCSVMVVKRPRSK